ncbi:hypothetical protein [Nocardioides sp. InS609-2]|uniref:hypothetical protein n=1 Tax=Nocardioides sp. InS609-2 TaxID=2760705 RepID=UPI0020BD8B33|nr:hypothetical protein [Nocardioides sp. InS609-2]
MTSLPDAARLAWWGTAWLRGLVVTDLLLDAVTGADAVHEVRDTSTGGPPMTLLDALLDVRNGGGDSLGLALPVEGDLLGLGGPAALNTDALEMGEAAVSGAAGIALVPHRVGRAVQWRLHPASRRQLPDVGEADRGLRAALLESANALAALDVARWRPEVADELMDLRRVAALDAPEGTPQRCVELAGRGLRCEAIAELALADDGGAVTTMEMTARRNALRPLEYAARRAVVAACSPEVWPG